MSVIITEVNNRAEGVAGDRRFRFVLPGEAVAEETAERLTASAERVPPFCPHFTRCGGCQLQHWAVAPYRLWKAGLVRQAFARHGIDCGEVPLIDAHGAGRRRVAWHARREAGRAVAGFMMIRSHDLIDIDHCPVLEPRLQASSSMARALAEIAGTSDLWVTAADNGLDAALKVERAVAATKLGKLVSVAKAQGVIRLSVNGEEVLVIAQPFVTFSGIAVGLPPFPFLQATRKGEEVLTDLVLKALSRARHVADLFAGLGPFSFALARQARVKAIDSDRMAISHMARGVRAAQGLKPITTEVRNLMTVPLTLAELDQFDAVLFDPPRAGAEAQVRKIAASRLRRVVAVSCEPQSLARDAAILIASGFRLEEITAVDQFKYTAHVECVASFRR